MDCPLHWRHVSTCYRVICAFCAYVTIRRTLGDTRCTPRHFVNKVSVRQFSAENKQESAEFYSQHLPMHSCDVIWKIKPKSTFPVSFSLVSAEMNLVGNYRTLRGLRTVNPEGLPSTNCAGDFYIVVFLPQRCEVSLWNTRLCQVSSFILLYEAVNCLASDVMIYWRRAKRTRLHDSMRTISDSWYRASDELQCMHGFGTELIRNLAIWLAVSQDYHLFIYKVYWYILSMFVPIFTSFGIENASLHSGRPRKLLPLISLSYFFLISWPPCFNTGHR